MICSLCPKTALTVVADQGFCKSHRAEAEAAMKALGSRKLATKPQSNIYTGRAH